VTRKRILFVDDEQSLLDGLRDILRKQRHEWDMVFARGGEAALDELSKCAFDVVVSDMRMPGMDGATLLREVQKTYPRTARIVLSGHADRDAVMRTVPVAHQYLSKPSDAGVLRTVIEDACRLQGLLDDDVIQVVACGLDKLPSAPRCFLELTEAMTGSAGGLASVAGIIERDPAMSAKVLQLANSAYFGAGHHVTSVQRAVVYLGVDLIQSLVSTTQVFDTLRDSEPPEVVALQAIQEHSLLTARLAKRLITDPARAEEAFAAGLVHDIGKIVLARAYRERYADVLALARRDRRPSYQVEKEVLGVTHAEAGAYLLGVWGLPAPIVETVAHHHTPRIVGAATREVLAAVHVANALTHGLTGSEPRLDDANAIDASYFNEAGLPSPLERWYEIAASELSGLAEVR
jgi:putative nucleotidyltransferase with HDIG domain